MKSGFSKPVLAALCGLTVLLVVFSSTFEHSGLAPDSDARFADGISDTPAAAESPLFLFPGLRELVHRENLAGVRHLNLKRDFYANRGQETP